MQPFWLMGFFHILIVPLRALLACFLLTHFQLSKRKVVTNGGEKETDSDDRIEAPSRAQQQSEPTRTPGAGDLAANDNTT
jgi:hypothetical protein